jgi:hypothetical protein
MEAWQPGPNGGHRKLCVLLWLGRFQPVVPTVLRMVSALP